MHKKLSDFKAVPTRDPLHPGTPVRETKAGDVWQNKHGQFFVVSLGGDRLTFGNPDDAEAHLKTAATSLPKPADDDTDGKADPKTKK